MRDNNFDTCDTIETVAAGVDWVDRGFRQWFGNPQTSTGSFSSGFSVQRVAKR